MPIDGIMRACITIDMHQTHCKLAFEAIGSGHKRRDGLDSGTGLESVEQSENITSWCSTDHDAGIVDKCVDPGVSLHTMRDVHDVQRSTVATHLSKIAGESFHGLQVAHVAHLKRAQSCVNGPLTSARYIGAARTMTLSLAAGTAACISAAASSPRLLSRTHMTTVQPLWRMSHATWRMAHTRPLQPT